MVSRTLYLSNTQKKTGLLHEFVSGKYLFFPDSQFTALPQQEKSLSDFILERWRSVMLPEYHIENTGILQAHAFEVEVDLYLFVRRDPGSTVLFPFGATEVVSRRTGSSVKREIGFNVAVAPGSNPLPEELFHFFRMTLQEFFGGTAAVVSRLYAESQHH